MILSATPITIKYFYGTSRRNINDFHANYTWLMLGPAEVGV